MKTITKKRIPTLDELAHQAARSEIASIGTVVAKIMAIIRSPNSSANELRQIVEVDPPLSAKVLRRANSASYGIKRNVASIQEAIVFIGFNTVREIAMSLKAGKLFEGGSSHGAFSRQMLWKHSLAVALCCKHLYRREFKENGDEIYSTALLHDIGVIAEDQFAHEHLMNALSLMEKEGKTLAEAEKVVLSFDHPELGQRLTSAWRIPENLTAAIACHHRPFACDPRWFKEAASIYVCDFACRDIGLAVEGKGGEEERASFLRALEALKTSLDAMEIIAEDVAKEIEELDKRGELYQ